MSNAKIQPEHQTRLAVVYVRQSTLHQVQHHPESTQRQYGLVEQAHQWGWPRDAILVIDDDLGRSGAAGTERQGFQRLLGEVALNHVGLILGLEISRLARSSKDWHQLLELCALFRTLIADLDGLYDPTHYNDRLLLGLKGTMSEAELHLLRQRLQQGALQKARRGELVSKVPIGYMRDAVGTVQQDPDEQVRAFVQLVFTQFARLGSASAVLRWLVQAAVRVPVRLDTGPRKGELEWRRPNQTVVHNLLTHPMYAGAYVYGRTCQNPTTRRARGVPQRLPREDWQVLLKDRYPAYISWEQFEQNVAQLAANRVGQAQPGAIREGRALLAGLVYCGRCGYRMMTRYRGKATQPRYICEAARAVYGQARCQSVAARPIDEEAVALALQALTPAALEVSLQVAQELEQERAQLETHWQRRLERARYEADRTRRQYQAVEPENRLVARTLEHAWEATLRTVQQLEQEYVRWQQEHPTRLSGAEHAQIRQLAADLPALWKAPTTTDAERKQILRQLLDRVVVTVEGISEWVAIEFQWIGGHCTSRRVHRPVGATHQLGNWEDLATQLRVLKSQGYSSPEIARQLQAKGFTPAKGGPITAPIVRAWLSRFGLTTARRDDLSSLADNEWTVPALVNRYQLPHGTIYGWIHRGQVQACQHGGPGGRWIITATEPELRRLLPGRRIKTQTGREHPQRYASTKDTSVTRGAV